MALDGLIDSGRRALRVAHRVVTPIRVLPAPLSRRFCGDMTVAGNAFSSPSALTTRAEHLVAIGDASHVAATADRLSVRRQATEAFGRCDCAKHPVRVRRLTRCRRSI